MFVFNISVTGGSSTEEIAFRIASKRTIISLLDKVLSIKRFNKIWTLSPQSSQLAFESYNRQCTVLNDLWAQISKQFVVLFNILLVLVMSFIVLTESACSLMFRLSPTELIASSSNQPATFSVDNLGSLLLAETDSKLLSLLQWILVSSYCEMRLWFNDLRFMKFLRSSIFESSIFCLLFTVLINYSYFSANL